MDKKHFPPVPRVKGEDERWYHRLLSFLLLGPGRSMRGAYLKEKPEKAGGSRVPKCVPSSWAKAAKRFKWIERAAAFDAELATMEKERFALDREAERKRRFALVRRLRKKIAECLILCNPNPIGATIRDVASLAGALRALSAVAIEEGDTAAILDRLDQLEARGREKPEADAYAKAMRRKYARDDEGGHDAPN